MSGCEITVFVTFTFEIVLNNPIDVSIEFLTLFHILNEYYQLYQGLDKHYECTNY